MKKILTIIILLLTSIAMPAQKLTVESFEAVVNDLSARTHSRNDNNGQGCALVKVQLAATGAVFEGNVMGDVANMTSEYWVYMPAGSKRLKVKHPSYIPLDVNFADYGVEQLECKTTYKLVVFMPSVKNTSQNTVVTSQYLIFKVDPTDALVMVNGEVWNNNNGMARKFVPFGQYTYTVQAQNYHDVNSSVSVHDSNNKVEVNVIMKPAFGQVSFIGNASTNGASVYIDNKLVGKVPMTLDKISSGTHSVRLAKPMYKSHEENIVVNDCETTRVSPSLIANYSEVTLKVDNDAEIWVNDVKKGKGTWKGKLEIGDYKIETRKENHRSKSQVHTIMDPSTPQSICLPAPSPIYGGLNIDVTPDGADIILDGKRIGESPLFLQQVLVGSHKVQLSLKGYKELKLNVSIKEGEVAGIKESLQKEVESIKEVVVNTIRGGELSSKITDYSISKLTVKGVMDARDFNFIKNNCKNIQFLDLSGIDIVEYSGHDGTDGNTYSYSKNEIPLGAFFYWVPVDDGMHSIKEIILPRGIRNIRRNAFARAYNLTNINIPEGVETIDFVAFAICTSLQKIELPSTLKKVDTLAFAGCGKLSRVFIDAVNPPQIANDAFSGISSGAILYVPNGSKSAYINSGWSNFFTILTP